MRGGRVRRYGDRGFTLIEIMVALVITLIVLRILFGGIAISLRIAQNTSGWERAVSIAESHMASIDDPASMLGERAGDDDGGFRWHTHVAIVGAAPAPRTVRAGPWSHGTGLYTVSVTIIWREGSRDQSFTLNSARLGAVPASGP